MLWPRLASASALCFCQAMCSDELFHTNKSSNTHSGTQQHRVRLNHSVLNPIKQCFHCPPLRCTLSWALYPVYPSKRNKQESWCVERIISGEFSLFTTISGDEMTVYMITGEQEELFTLQLMSEGGTSHFRMMSPLFEKQ